MYDVFTVILIQFFEILLIAYRLVQPFPTERRKCNFGGDFLILKLGKLIER